MGSGYRGCHSLSLSSMSRESIQKRMNFFFHSFFENMYVINSRSFLIAHWIYIQQQTSHSKNFPLSSVLLQKPRFHIASSIIPRHGLRFFSSNRTGLDLHSQCYQTSQSHCFSTGDFQKEHPPLNSSYLETFSLTSPSFKNS